MARAQSPDSASSQFFIVVKDSGGQSGTEPRRFWEALRPAVLAHDPTYRGNNAGFCAAYGRGNYAPDLKLWEGGR